MLKRKSIVKSNSEIKTLFGFSFVSVQCVGFGEYSGRENSKLSLFLCHFTKFGQENVHNMGPYCTVVSGLTSLEQSKYGKKAKKNKWSDKTEKLYA